MNTNIRQQLDDALRARGFATQHERDDIALIVQHVIATTRGVAATMITHERDTYGVGITVGAYDNAHDTVLDVGEDTIVARIVDDINSGEIDDIAYN
jgi:hypothetical protein